MQKVVLPQVFCVMKPSTCKPLNEALPVQGSRYAAYRKVAILNDSLCFGLI